MKRDFTLTLDGTDYKVVVDGNSILVNGQPFVVGLDGERALVDGTPYEVKLDVGAERVVVEGIAYSLRIAGLDAGPEKAIARAGRAAVASAGAVTAIMPGKIIRLLAAEGDRVTEGDVVCILEAMKMENELKAPRTGTIKALHVVPGQDVERGAVLAEIE